MKQRCAIIGGGGVGSAAARYLAEAGHEVTVFERFEPDHDRGSSYGSSRIIRRSYPDATYTRLMNEAYPLWAELEEAAGEELFVRCGGLFLGPRDHADLEAVVAALDANGVAYERMPGAVAAERFGALHFEATEEAIYQADGGFLRASNVVRANYRLATAAGARVRSGCPVGAVAPSGSEIVVATETGEQSTFDAALVSAGPWLSDFAPALPLRVTHQQYAHFPAADPAPYEPSALPIWIDVGGNERGEVYGFPADGRVPGVKVAEHSEGPGVDPNRSERHIDQVDLERLATYAARRLPGLDVSSPTFTKTCLYTNTPDHDFIIDRAPDAPRLLLLGGLSGHGFKFSVLLGRVAADLLESDEAPAARLGTSRFRLDRFEPTRLLP